MNFIAASLVGVVSMEIGGPTGVVVGTILLTAVVLLFCESIPKTVAAIFPERIALPASRIYHPLVKFTQQKIDLSFLCIRSPTHPAIPIIMGLH